jgi:hypothetical protein
VSCLREASRRRGGAVAFESGVPFRARGRCLEARASCCRRQRTTLIVQTTHGGLSSRLGCCPGGEALIFEAGALSRVRVSRLEGGAVVLVARMSPRGRGRRLESGWVILTRSPFSGRVRRLEGGAVILEVTAASLRRARRPNTGDFVSKMAASF